MIKSNELRIGNWVSYLGAIVQLDRHDLSDLFNPSIDMYEMDLEPIELTEEILLKCGFEFSHITGDERVFSNKKINLLINAYDNNIIKFNVFIIKHLHQLQNLYFALTNKELEINL